jgi:tRNA dimethylallyltransferase
MELILLLGCTSSGKTDMAVELAKKLNSAVIVSCDSRQVYKGLDLLSGKANGQVSDSKHFEHGCYLYSGIEHFMIDIVDLDTVYTLDRFIHDFIYLVNNLKNVDYVILTGGTGLYARAIYEQYQLSVKIINQELENLTLAQLQSRLNQLDFNNSDWNNRIRLINKLSTNSENKKIIYPKFSKQSKYIIKVDKTIIAKKVQDRIVTRINNGMIEELELLLNNNSYSRMMSLGLESRFTSFYLLGMVTKEELISILTYQTMQYVKRQLTWLNKEKDAQWINTIGDIKEDIN